MALSHLKFLQDQLELCLTFGNLQDIDQTEVIEYAKWMDSFRLNNQKYFEALGQTPSCPHPSIEQPPYLELKPLPGHLRYAFLGESSPLPVIISSQLIDDEEEKF